MSSLIQDYSSRIVSNVEEEGGFTFAPVNSYQIETLKNKENQEILFRWGLENSLHAVAFRINEHCSDDDEKTILENFIASNDVQDKLRSAGLSFPRSLSEVKYEKCRTTLVSSTPIEELFLENDITGDNGAIRGRFFDDYEGIEISTRLAEALLVESSELYDAIPHDMRKEFLFQILSVLVVGGKSNQFDDYIQPYLNITKSLYRDFTTARKNAQGDIHIHTHVYRILSFPKKKEIFGEHLWLLFDPIQRRVVVFFNERKNQYW